MLKVYFDTEFTGLQMPTTLVSIGCVSENDYEFYAEFYDYDKSQIDKWIYDNVICNLKYNEFETCLKQMPPGLVTEEYSIEMKNNKQGVMLEFGRWLGRLAPEVELISDGFIPHDNKLVLDLFEGNLPAGISLSNRSLNDEVLSFVNSNVEYNRIMNEWQSREHNALSDARGIKNIYEKINR